MAQPGFEVDFPPEIGNLSRIEVLFDGARGGWIINVEYLDRNYNEATWTGHRLFLQGVQDVITSIRQKNSSL